MRQRRQQLYSTWIVPSIYAITSVAMGLALPRIERHFFPELSAGTSVSAAMAIYTSVASGMISLTAIVFALTMMVVPFGATAYSPRLVLWLSRDPLLSHALGVFTATFLYAIGALASLDRNGSAQVPFISAWLVVALLLASIGMLIGLIQRLGFFQIGRMLAFTGDQGRRVIAKMYSPLEAATSVSMSNEYRRLPCTQTLIYRGRPKAVQALNIDELLKLAERHGAVIEMVASVGDTIVEPTPILRIYGSDAIIDERALRNTIEFGTERTFQQDPKYAIRLLVDIAIRALSPAVNDPTTAVQALDQITDLLIRLGRSHLDIGRLHDGNGELRLIVPFPSWEDFVRVALDEIQFYGAMSVQVMRRMKALLGDLQSVLPPERHPTLNRWEERLQEAVSRSFANMAEKLEASEADRQGLGIPWRRSA
jgi:uncharacterized membrane protein